MGAAAVGGGSLGFFLICMLHSIIALTCGVLMMFYTNEVTVFGHGIEIATRLKGSTPHDELLIQTSDSFSGLLLFVIGLLLFMVAFVRDGVPDLLCQRLCTAPHVGGNLAGRL